MNPSPPNRPTPIFFWNAMPMRMPLAAQTNESFWQTISGVEGDLDVLHLLAEDLVVDDVGLGVRADVGGRGVIDRRRHRGGARAGARAEPAGDDGDVTRGDPVEHVRPEDGRVGALAVDDGDEFFQ